MEKYIGVKVKACIFLCETWGKGRMAESGLCFKKKKKKILGGSHWGKCCGSNYQCNSNFININSNKTKWIKIN